MTELEAFQDALDVVGLEIIAALKKHNVQKNLTFEELVEEISRVAPESLERMSKLVDQIEVLKKH